RRRGPPRPAAHRGSRRRGGRAGERPGHAACHLRLLRARVGYNRATERELTWIDHWAGRATRCRGDGIRPTSPGYAALLPTLNSGRVELLDHPRLVGGLCGLERGTGGGGRVSMDVGPGGQADLANAAVGVLVVAAQPQDFGEIFAVNLAPEPRRPVDWEAEFGWERWP